MPAIIISADTAREILFEDHESAEVIEDTITDTSRWSIHHELIFKYLDKFWRTNYSEGATEYQDERPFEYEKEVTCYEVQQVEKLVKVWEPVK